MSLRWSKYALRDLEEIGDFIAEANLVAASKIVSRILGQTDLLAAHPHLGRAGRVLRTRELVISETDFIAAYRVVGENVEILAVMHGARRWPDSFPK